jgi:alpha-mannosidase
MRSVCHLSFGFDVSSAALCNLMEEHDNKIAVNNNGIEIVLKPFEIITLRIKKG